MRNTFVHMQLDLDLTLPVIPAKAGIQVTRGSEFSTNPLDSRFRGNDGEG